ncbi:AGAP011095-PA-like protein [Anopheles sinensis]|uniref:AGAP011095-PA-like protein n=1 Tax=Anopheles sinensis TaxID=74873 RepID=A0A084W8E3_ANOSI|nr:AGAP011095-PA-like protein [Anopheles sinensis]
MNVFERLDEEEAGDVVAGSPKDPLEEDMHDQRELFEREGLASVLRDTQVQPERHRSGTEDTHHTAYKRHRRSLMRRRSIRMKETAITKAEETAGADDDSSNPHPAVVVENPTHPPVDDPKNHPSAEGASNYGIKSDSSSTRNTPGVVPTQEATIVLQNVSHEPAQEATSMVAQTTTPPQRRVPGEPQPAAIGFDSFNLLDDSVFIATGHGHRNDSGMTGRLPPLGTDLTLDEHGNIFGDGVGENFDEQIIFLNGPDLLETSVEQQQQQMASRSRRPLGKVAREALDEPQALPLRPIIRGPSEEHVVEDNVVVVYADQHETVRLNCEVDADITTSVWLKDGQIVHVMDKKSRTADIRFVREPLGGLTIQNVMLEDDGVWQCEAENARGFFFNGRPIKLIVLDPPKEPYLLIDSRRLDAGNMFIPVKENSELTLACVSEGGNPKPTLTWEVLLSPGIDRHAQKISSEVLELQEIKKDKDKEPYKINSGAISEVKLPGVFRVHHNARILCIMEHPTLKVRQNASILLDVQYTPSFAITRTPGFGYPLREGIEVSLKCDVDSNPPSTPLWQKDDGDTPVPQIGDGFLNFSSIRREHSGWYKCTSRHLNFQYSSIGYYLSVRYEPVDVTSEPVEHDLSMSPSSSSSSSSASAASSSSGSNSFKAGQMEVELGGSVTLQCPQGSLGCWSHLDPVTARLKGLGAGIYTPTGQFSLKDVVYQDAGTYKCVGQNASNRKKLEVLQTVSIAVKGAPSVSARNTTPVAYPGSPLHLSVEFCANPPAYAARWLHGDRVYTPGNQYGSDVLAYGFIDLPTPFCKEARLTYVHMHEKVPRTFYFIVSSPGGVAEAVFRVNYTLKHKQIGSSSGASASGAGSGPFGSPPFSLSASSSSSSSSGTTVNGGSSGYKINTNTINTVPGNGLDDDEELMEPEEIHFPIFGTGGVGGRASRPGWLPVSIAMAIGSWGIVTVFTLSRSWAHC